ncbi:hypothetical protein M409DRAFT_22857 [Zasmidium cellare ATCC 36951]|uniref:Uncharacterized protein n=1 Tax=Zasmidium cellare ATCC 36951 TaxID=1080233 RepID=A0A6A6CJL9_ZASCE|nr:uncharacterized protein M409DRAFT_22857 [Zasmidium cellare ATCC 36951]KAF2166803.1 hypothetical protein M409DRAFT_22857 [Zasmidium cellare ATCC 36951]
MKFTTILASLILGVSSLPTSPVDTAANDARLAVLDRAKELGDNFQAAMADVLTNEEIASYKADVTRVAEDAVGNLANTTYLDGLAQEWHDNLSPVVKEKMAHLRDKSQRRDTMKCDWRHFAETMCGQVPKCSINENLCGP